jgi:hypothetical protein
MRSWFRKGFVEGDLAELFHLFERKNYSKMKMQGAVCFDFV